MFNMAIALCGQVVAPFDASIVVIVKRSGHIGIIDGITKRLEMKEQVSGVNGETRAHSRSANLRVAQTQGAEA